MAPSVLVHLVTVHLHHHEKVVGVYDNLQDAKEAAEQVRILDPLLFDSVRVVSHSLTDASIMVETKKHLEFHSFVEAVPPENIDSPLMYRQVPKNCLFDQDFVRLMCALFSALVATL